MTSPVETTAAMTPPAEQHDPAGTAAASGTAALAEPASEAVASVSREAGEQATVRRELSQNAVLGLFGGLVTALLGGLIGLMMWQFNSLGARIDGQSARIDSQSARIDSFGADLRAEMSKLEAGLRTDMDDLEAGLRTDMDDLEAGLRAGMDDLEAGLRAGMDDLEAGLRAEMRAGFAEISRVLLDHTDRLARLETTAGLLRPDG